MISRNRGTSLGCALRIRLLMRRHSTAAFLIIIIRNAAVEWRRMSIRIRKAQPSDVPRLREIIEASVRGLQAHDYSAAQIEGALAGVYGVDSQLIADGTYFVAEVTAGNGQEIVGCGGWSKRKTLYGGDQYAGREDSLLDPATDAA